MWQMQLWLSMGCCASSLMLQSMVGQVPSTKPDRYNPCVRPVIPILVHSGIKIKIDVVCAVTATNVSLAISELLNS